MNEPSPPGDELLSPTLARQMDRICDRFEAAWKEGQRPRIDDYLREVPEAERPGLLHELLRLERDYLQGDRQAVGPLWDRYLTRLVQLARIRRLWEKELAP